MRMPSREASGDAYLPMGEYYRWCVETGRAAISVFAQSLVQRVIPSMLAQPQPGFTIDAAIFTYIDGDAAQRRCNT